MEEAVAVIFILCFSGVSALCIVQVRELTSRLNDSERNLLLMRDVMNQNMFAIQNQINRLQERDDSYITLH